MPDEHERMKPIPYNYLNNIEFIEAQREFSLLVLVNINFFIIPRVKPNPLMV